MSKNKKGFSLIEIVVAIGMLSLIILAFSMIINSSYKVFRYSQTELSSLSKASAIMRDFERTVRGAEEFFAPEEGKTQTNSLTFLAYQKGDAYISPSKISYYFEDDTLKKSVIKPKIEDGIPTYPDEDKKITSFAGKITDHDIFSYANTNNQGFSPELDTSLILMVSIEVTVVGDPPATETTVVQLRNMKK